MELKYKYYNANPHKEDCNDCSMRALSLFLNISWEEAYTKLFKLSLKLKLQFNSPIVIRTLLKELGYEEIQGGVKIKHFSVEQKKDYLVWARIKKRKDYIHHLICIKNSTIFDTFNPQNYQSILYWEKGSKEL